VADNAEAAAADVHGNSSPLHRLKSHSFSGLKGIGNLFCDVRGAILDTSLRATYALTINQTGRPSDLLLAAYEAAPRFTGRVTARA
jgi:hypothetical protein